MSSDSAAVLPPPKPAAPRRLPVGGFFLGLLVAIAAAWLFPEPGAKGGILQGKLVGDIGVFFIFFAQGVLLPTENLRKGLMHWRLHLFIQAGSFVAFPLLALGLDGVFGGFLSRDLRIGFLYLAILPTTISTAVVFITHLKGDLPAAIFNTAVSSLLGVFIVPAWMAWLLSSGAAAPVQTGPLLWKICQLLLLPLVVGQIARPWLKGFFAAHKRVIGRVNTTIIFFIIHTTFCDAFKEGVWQKQGLGPALTAGLGALLLLLISTALVWWLTGLLRFSRESRITALFCASQKTLATGVPVANAIFAAAGAAGAGAGLPALGVVLLPLMFYHPLQILLGGLMMPLLEEAEQTSNIQHPISNVQ